MSSQGQSLKNSVHSLIKDNYNEEITPSIVNNALDMIIDFADGNLVVQGSNFTFGGKVMLSTNPNYDIIKEVLVIATDVGTYTNFRDDTNTQLEIQDTDLFALFHKLSGVDSWIKYSVAKQEIPDLDRPYNDYAITGIIDGENDTFTTTYEFDYSTLEVYLSGQRKRPGIDYVSDPEETEDYSTIRFLIPPEVGTSLIATYHKRII